MNRKRWRVRLYERKEVIHQSYHKSLPEALQAYHTARARYSQPTFNSAALLDLLEESS